MRRAVPTVSPAPLSFPPLSPPQSLTSLLSQSSQSSQSQSQSPFLVLHADVSLPVFSNTQRSLSRAWLYCSANENTTDIRVCLFSYFISLALLFIVLSLSLCFPFQLNLRHSVVHDVRVCGIDCNFAHREIFDVVVPGSVGFETSEATSTRSKAKEITNYGFIIFPHFLITFITLITF